MTKKAIKDYYREWCDYRGYKPNRATVTMYWEDEGKEETHTDTIALETYDITPEDDEEVLFYASGLKGLMELMKPNNGSDFVVTEVLEFFKV